MNRVKPVGAHLQRPPECRAFLCWMTVWASKASPSNTRRHVHEKKYQAQAPLASRQGATRGSVTPGRGARIGNHVAEGAGTRRCQRVGRGCAESNLPASAVNERIGKCPAFKLLYHQSEGGRVGDRRRQEPRQLQQERVVGHPHQHLPAGRTGRPHRSNQIERTGENKNKTRGRGKKVSEQDDQEVGAPCSV